MKDGVTTTWTYDATYRLTGQQKTGEFATYSYDSVGNVLVQMRQTVPVETHTYDAANRIVTSARNATITTFTYDSNGNPTLENIATNPQTYTYDKENRLTVVQWSGGTAHSTYTYAGDGLRRSLFEQGGTLTTTIWDGDDYLMEKS